MSGPGPWVRKDASSSCCWVNLASTVKKQGFERAGTVRIVASISACHSGLKT